MSIDFNDLYLTFKIIDKGKWLKYIYIVLVIASTSFLFTILHVNRYQDIPFLIELFVAGIFYGTCYWVTKDLTACILAHLLRNILSVRELGISIPGFIIIFLYIFYIFVLEEKSSNY
ncbi:hypothetical protein LCGC14_1176170 [marine sediment metagenome]|uniref:CAAX prenyl protease 2/Lysostaphin resistance protein A-like domain-containing protein n=1 Tax=marine sediment metagenome TaxID=412755 RepID=A0A0F9MBD0_9ZZZZ|nr:CPBP family intramembrane metalloprotease [bacterium]